MITYVLNLNSHWQLRHCCSWRRGADLHIYCQWRDRGEFYWPERIICIREAKQGCSDLLEYSAGSKGTGLELCGIVCVNANCVLCVLCCSTRLSVPWGLAREALSAALCLSMVLRRACCQPPQGCLLKNGKTSDCNIVNPRNSICIFSELMVHWVTPSGDSLLYLPLEMNPQKSLKGIPNEQFCFLFSPRSPSLSVSEHFLSGNTCSW